MRYAMNMLWCEEIGKGKSLMKLDMDEIFEYEVGVGY